VAGFREPEPDLIAPNPGGAEDPLGESVADPARPWLRIFEPRDVRIVIGRHQRARREVLLDAARDDAVPIHRRFAGGGSVVLAPGMLVVALRTAVDGPDPQKVFAGVNRALGQGIAAACGIEPVCRGHGDLAIREGGSERKVVGASLRIVRARAFYLGVCLHRDAAAPMDRYLAHPSREPEYREGRSHGDFCTHLGRWCPEISDLRAAIEAYCRSSSLATSSGKGPTS